VLGLFEKRVFSAKDVFETRQGVCRLMPAVTQPLAEHTPTLARWVAPWAERIARGLVCGNSQSTKGEQVLTTPLTQRNRSAGRDGLRVGERRELRAGMPLPNACKGCEMILADASRVWCDSYYAERRLEKDRANVAIATAAKAPMRAEGRDPSHVWAAGQKLRAAHLEQMRLNVEWEVSNEPTLTEAEYREQILPLVVKRPVMEPADRMGVSRGTRRW